MKSIYNCHVVLRTTRARFSSFPLHSARFAAPVLNASIGLIGIQEDRNSSFQQGAAEAPDLIRCAFHSHANNTTSELGLDLFPCAATSVVLDYGNYVFASPSSNDIYDKVQPVIDDIINHNLVPISLGGDHSISFPITKAIRRAIGQPFVIVHFDAHPDIYPDFEGNPSSHASPFARICELRSQQSQESICSKLISIGIRTANSIQQKQIDKYDVTVIAAKDFPAKGSAIISILQKYIPTEDTPVYISFDLDAIDPGFAPGVSHREPGGLSVRQAIDAIHCIPGIS